MPTPAPHPEITEAETYRAIVGSLFPHGSDPGRYHDVQFTPRDDRHRPTYALPDHAYTRWNLTFAHEDKPYEVRHDSVVRAARTIARRTNELDPGTRYLCQRLLIPNPDDRATAVRVLDRRIADLVVQFAAFGSLRLPEIVMNTYAWVVDSTPVEDPDDDTKMVEAPADDTRTGTFGPHDAPAELLHKLLVRGEGRTWRTLYDSDHPDHPAEQRIVHVGRYLDLSDTRRPGAEAVRATVSPNAEFGPLDDLSKPDCGATEIQYQRPDGRWVTL